MPAPADTPAAKCSLPDWNPARIRSLGHWQGGALVREYERPARRADLKPANDNRQVDAKPARTAA